MLDKKGISLLGVKETGKVVPEFPERLDDGSELPAEAKRIKAAAKVSEEPLLKLDMKCISCSPV